ncbi:MAG TPA: 7TM domain-containing protein [Gemmataceae bacterium]|nr:7TM domain-containing protein [Gemmataceae bacterium]
MSRTTLSVATAACLAAASLCLMIGRYHVLGREVKVPLGPSTWKVTMLVQGRLAKADAKLMTGMPLDFGRQHIWKESCRSNELLPKPPEAKHPERHHVLWSARPTAGAGPFRAVYQFFCAVDYHSSTAAMSRTARALYAPPERGTLLESEPRLESNHPEITSLAHQLTAGMNDTQDQLKALYQFVASEIANEPQTNGAGVSALECLQNGGGNAGAKSRLLACLCRNRGIPARLVKGLALKEGHEQNAHTWVEAWVHNHWVSLCPFYHHLGHVPSSYIIFAYDDVPLVRGRDVRDVNFAFLVERPDLNAEETARGDSTLYRMLRRLSLYALPPAEQRLVEFLLLLPIAAFIVCIFRNLVGLDSFGTFAPALVGLAFRELGSLPGILVFLSIVLIGWLMRRVMDHFHLLQVPRKAIMLSLVVIILIGGILTANLYDLPATKYISLFPMVILTGMIERFWTLEVEDGTSSSFKTLLGTLVIAATISLLLGLHAVVRHMFRYPETLGLIMAGQLLIGRYTGYRLSELFRFRDFLNESTVISH